MTRTEELAKRSSFSYNLTERSGIKFIVIKDHNVGLSVTNNIENIVSYIAEEEDINSNEYIVLYKDSEAVWDGWRPTTEDFIYIGAESEEDAIQTFTTNRVDQLLNSYE